MEIDTNKTSRAVWSAWAVVVLIAALGLGLGIRKIRTWQAEADREAMTKAKAKTVAAAVKDAVEPVEETPEVTEFEAVAAVEPNEEVVVAVETEEVKEEDPCDTPEAEPMQGMGMMGQGGERWRQMWADLNLTPEEQARLREGFALAMQRWQNMPEDERQAEMARMRGMREQWEGMSDEEREAAMGRMRDRFEAWRASGAVELPQLTLD
jgi:hypothetical protein